MKNTLVVVMGHGAAQDTFDRHVPLWEAHGAKIQVNSPENDPLDAYPNGYVRLGKSAHNGDDAYWRFRLTITYLATLPYDQFLIHEYDSFCLDPVIRPVKGIQAVLCDNTEVRFREPKYCIPPIQMDLESVQRLAREASMDEGPICFGFFDRLLANWAARARIRLEAWQPTGIAISKIDVEHLKYVRDAIMSGVSAVHGVKTEMILDLVLQWRKEYIAAHSQSAPASSGKPGSRRR